MAGHYPASWCCTCESFVQSDQTGIQENNWNFPGAEIHVQTGSPQKKRISLMKAKGGVVGCKLRPFLDKLSQVCLFTFLQGRLTHTHFAQCVHIYSTNPHTLSNAPVCSIHPHTGLTPWAQISACVLTPKTYTLWFRLKQHESSHSTKALKWNVKLLSATLYYTLLRKRTFLKTAK